MTTSRRTPVGNPKKAVADELYVAAQDAWVVMNGERQAKGRKLSYFKVKGRLAAALEAYRNDEGDDVEGADPTAGLHFNETKEPHG